MRRIDSTHSTWLFDTERMRFCRSRGLDPSSITARQRVAAVLRARDRSLRAAFTVALNADHTRLLRVREEPEPTKDLDLHRRARIVAISSHRVIRRTRVRSAECSTLLLHLLRRRLLRSRGAARGIEPGAARGRRRRPTARCSSSPAPGRARRACSRTASPSSSPSKRVSPFGLAAITFTNKAAGEMKERVAELVGPVARAHVGVDVPLDVRAHPAPRSAGARDTARRSRSTTRPTPSASSTTCGATSTWIPSASRPGACTRRSRR